LDKHESIFAQDLHFSRRLEEMDQGAMITRTGRAEKQKLNYDIEFSDPKGKTKKKARRG